MKTDNTLIVVDLFTDICNKSASRRDSSCYNYECQTINHLYLLKAEFQFALSHFHSQTKHIDDLANYPLIQRVLATANCNMDRHFPFSVRA